jgi:hypothetical protein
LNADKDIARFTLDNGRKLIVTYSKKRAKKDKSDREKGLIVNENSTLSNDEIITQYSNLWQVEESFRITKQD